MKKSSAKYQTTDQNKLGSNFKVTNFKQQHLFMWNIHVIEYFLCISLLIVIYHQNRTQL